MSDAPEQQPDQGFGFGGQQGPWPQPAPAAGLATDTSFGPVRFETRIMVDIGIPVGREPALANPMPDPTEFADLVAAALDILRPLGFVYDAAFGAHVWPRGLYAGQDEDAVVGIARWTPHTGLLIRGSISEAGLDALTTQEPPAFPGVFVDLPVALQSAAAPPPFPQPPGPDDGTVRKQIGATVWHQAGLTGSGVAIALVDFGINLGRLRQAWGQVDFDQSWSWSRTATVRPGQAVHLHGTMCAYDALVCAPGATLIDLAAIETIQGDALRSLLSDVLVALLHVWPLAYALKVGPQVAGGFRTFDALVISNSWAVVHPELEQWLPASAKYLGNHQHPVNVVVASLDWCGADVLFAAGNCGPMNGQWPAGCARATTHAIYGANSSPHVLTVTAAGLNDMPMQQVSRGPGWLHTQKPDLACYSGFFGPNFVQWNGGTSAACATAAGAVALYRSGPYVVGARPSPADVRDTLRKSAAQVQGITNPYHEGHGILRLP